MEAGLAGLDGVLVLSLAAEVLKLVLEIVTILLYSMEATTVLGLIQTLSLVILIVV